jgi:hypothetical protein
MTYLAPVAQQHKPEAGGRAQNRSATSRLFQVVQNHLLPESNVLIFPAYIIIYYFMTVK